MIDVFVCSKPLQYCNIKNIPLSKYSIKKVLIIEDYFNGAESFKNGVEMFDDFWDEVLFSHGKRFTNRYLRSNRIRNLYIDNDSSWSLYFTYLKGHIKNVYAYEEGLGSYSHEHGGKTRPCFRRFIRSFLGVGIRHGDSYKCRGIYLYFPDLYNKLFKKRGMKFQSSFLDNLKIHNDLFMKLFGDFPDYLNVKHKKILLYLTSWTIDDGVLNEIERESHRYDLVIIKLHPHITNKLRFNNSIIKVMQSNILAEMVMGYIIDNENDLCVWHYCSASVLYFQGVVEQRKMNYIESYELFINNLKQIK